MDTEMALHLWRGVALQKLSVDGESHLNVTTPWIIRGGGGGCGEVVIAIRSALAPGTRGKRKSSDLARSLHTLR